MKHNRWEYSECPRDSKANSCDPGEKKMFGAISFSENEVGSLLLL